MPGAVVIARAGSNLFMALAVAMLGAFLSPPPREVSADAQPPYIMANPAAHWIFAFRWPLGATLQMTIHRPGTNPSPDFVMSAVARQTSDFPDITNAYFGINSDINLVPGTMITVSGGDITRTLTIADFAVAGWDIKSSWFRGRATPGSSVFVCSDNSPGTPCWFAAADASGNWQAFPSGPNAYSLQSNSYGWAGENDGDGDITRMDWDISKLAVDGDVFADPESNTISLENLEQYRDYFLTIAHASDPTRVLYSTAGIPGQQASSADFPLKDFDLQIDDLVIVSDSFQQRSLVMKDMGTMEADIDADIVTGKTSPYSVVMIGSETWRYAWADENGFWKVDFHNPGQERQSNEPADGPGTLDLVPGLDGNLSDADEDLDFSMVNWHLPSITPITVTPGLTTNIEDTVTASLIYQEPAGLQNYAVHWDWGDGAITEDQTLSSPNISASHRYTRQGIFTITATVRERTGRVAETEHLQNLVVTGTSSRILTGQGWFSSPGGCSPTNPDLSGTTSFWFLNAHPRFLKSPVGIVLFRIGRLNLVSNAFDWLTVDEGQMTLRGSGWIDGQGPYDFLLTALDGESEIEDQPDGIRMKIWNAATGQTVYDSQPGDSSGLTQLVGGSVEIQ